MFFHRNNLKYIVTYQFPTVQDENLFARLNPRNVVLLTNSRASQGINQKIKKKRKNQ